MHTVYSTHTLTLLNGMRRTSADSIDNHGTMGGPPDEMTNVKNVVKMAVSVVQYIHG